MAGNAVRVFSGVLLVSLSEGWHGQQSGLDEKEGRRGGGEGFRGVGQKPVTAVHGLRRFLCTLKIGGAKRDSNASKRLVHLP